MNTVFTSTVCACAFSYLYVESTRTRASTLCTRTHTRMHMHTHTHTHTPTHTHTHTHSHTHAHTHTHTHTHMRACKLRHTCMCGHANTRVRTTHKHRDIHPLERKSEVTACSTRAGLEASRIHTKELHVLHPRRSGPHRQGRGENSAKSILHMLPALPTYDLHPHPHLPSLHCLPPPPSSVIALFYFNENRLL